MTVRERFAALATTMTRTEPRPANLARAFRVEMLEGASSATVWIYDEIGGWGIWASELVPELAALDVDTITVRINSPGGDYFDGVAIGNALAQHRATVVMQIDGLAASAASIIAMAGDEIVMQPGSQMMIHDALTRTVGNAADHEKTRNLLDAASADIASLYAIRTLRGSADTWRDAMRAETWYRGDEAVAAGLATSVAPGKSKPAPENTWREALAAYRYSAPIEPSLPANTHPEHLVSAMRKALSPCPLP